MFIQYLRIYVVMLCPWGVSTARICELYPSREISVFPIRYGKRKRKTLERGVGIILIKKKKNKQTRKTGGGGNTIILPKRRLLLGS